MSARPSPGMRLMLDQAAREPVLPRPTKRASAAALVARGWLRQRWDRRYEITDAGRAAHAEMFAAQPHRPHLLENWDKARKGQWARRHAP